MKDNGLICMKLFLHRNNFKRYTIRLFLDMNLAYKKTFLAEQKNNVEN